MKSLDLEYDSSDRLEYLLRFYFLQVNLQRMTFNEALCGIFGHRRKPECLNWTAPRITPQSEFIENHCIFQDNTNEDDVEADGTFEDNREEEFKGRLNLFPELITNNVDSDPESESTDSAPLESSESLESSDSLESSASFHSASPEPAPLPSNTISIGDYVKFGLNLDPRSRCDYFLTGIHLTGLYDGQFVKWSADNVMAPDDVEIVTDIDSATFFSRDSSFINEYYNGAATEVYTCQLFNGSIEKELNMLVDHVNIKQIVNMRLMEMGPVPINVYFPNLEKENANNTLPSELAKSFYENVIYPAFQDVSHLGRDQIPSSYSTESYKAKSGRRGTFHKTIQLPTYKVIKFLKAMRRHSQRASVSSSLREYYFVGNIVNIKSLTATPDFSSPELFFQLYRQIDWKNVDKVWFDIGMEIHPRKEYFLLWNRTFVLLYLKKLFAVNAKFDPFCQIPSIGGGRAYCKNSSNALNGNLISLTCLPQEKTAQEKTKI